MKEVVVLGVGMTPFGRFPDIPFQSLGADAVMEALDDAGLQWKDIPMVYCSSVVGGSTPGQRVQLELGSTGIPIVNVSNACASGNTAFFMAYQAIASGLTDMVLTLGLEKMGRGMLGNRDANEALRGLLRGGHAPAEKYGLIARRRIHEGRCTSEQMAKVSVKNHKNGSYNPRAHYRKELTVEEVLASRMICDPLHLYDCCPTTDGAAAVILCTEAIARRHSVRTLIKVASCGLASEPYVRGDPYSVWQLSHNATFEAYEKAGIGPEDVDVIELHDAYTVGELEHYEDMGLCEIGEAGRLIDEGATEINGRIPVNPSGGLQARGHPLGATGVAQICELVWQLRGQAGQRQVKDPKVAVAQCVGGGGGEACCVNVLKK